MKAPSKKIANKSAVIALSAGEKDLSDGAAAIFLANRWLKAVAALLGTQGACVIVGDRSMARVVARHNIPHAFMTTDVTVASAPYAPDDRVLVADATGRPDLHAFLGGIAFAKTGFYFRRPLQITGDRMISMVAFGEVPRPDIGEAEITIVDEIADALAIELERFYPSGTRNMAAPMRMSLEDITRWLHGTDIPAALFDTDLNLRAANARMRALIPANWDAIIGRPLSSIDLPARASLEFMFRHAIDTNISTPRMDLALEDNAGAGLPLMMRVVGSPMTPLDGKPILIATLDPALLEEAPMRAFPGFGRHGQEATTEFLLETLVQKRALRGRKDVSYVTLRSWRQSIRAHQISALKAIKRHAPEDLAAEIAAEMGDDVKSLFGAGSFRAVVPMPCGHSSAGRCLSLAIAKALARDLGLPVVHALSLPQEKGSSHPKTNMKRAPMTLTNAVEGPLLLIDDVATSGRHIEEATTLLRGAGASVLALAWIGGDSEKDAAED
jgi:predicted amidophosphoribosyltransferase